MTKENVKEETMKSRKAKTITATMVVVCACGLLTYTLIATGGGLEPIAPPGPTMKTLAEVEPRTPISSLPYTISTPGSYYLTGDLTLTDTAVNGITVNADNVTIDLMGYSLNGPGSGSGTNYGIHINGRSNVEVRNGTVRRFGSVGIYDYYTADRGHRIIAVRAVSNGDCGIELRCRGNLVKDCTAAHNGKAGIVVYWGSTVTGNTAYNNQDDGIYADSGSTVTGNTAYNNQSHGIHARPGCTVTGNSAYYNQRNGIYLNGHNLLDQNTAYNNNQSGGSFINMDLTRTDCTYGVNHAP